jgi:hypothetical protein
MSTMNQWGNVQNVSDFDELFANKLIPVTDLQIFFLDALTLAINDLHV